MTMIPKRIYLRKAEFDDLFTSKRMVACDEPYRDLTIEFTNLSAIWHDANEKPRTKEWLLVQFDEDDYDTIYLYIDSWCDWCKNFNVIQWAYISDLLPKGGEK